MKGADLLPLLFIKEIVMSNTEHLQLRISKKLKNALERGAKKKKKTVPVFIRDLLAKNLIPELSDDYIKSLKSVEKEINKNLKSFEKSVNQIVGTLK
jgi:hypothetical protein